MGGVSQNPPRFILKLVPLFEKVVPTVVSQAADQLPVRNRHLRQMRCVNNQLPTFCQHRLQFVHALPRHPKFVIHLRSTGEDLVERLLLPNDVELFREISCLFPRRLGCSDKKTRQRRIRSNDHRSTPFPRFDQSSRPVDHLPNRRPLLPDDSRIGHDRSEPMKKVQNLGPADPRKEILVAARKADDLMRKSRPQNH